MSNAALKRAQSQLTDLEKRRKSRETAREAAVSAWNIQDADQVPPPERKSWPFRHMMPGQTVFVPTETEAERERVRNVIYGYHERGTARFQTKFDVENGQDGLRVWRIG